MKFTERERAIKKERAYAEKRFTQLLAEADKIKNIESPEDQATRLHFLDSKWRDFCKNLIYLKKAGEDEFMKVARERVYQKVEV